MKILKPDSQSPNDPPKNPKKKFGRNFYPHRNFYGLWFSQNNWISHLMPHFLPVWEIAKVAKGVPKTAILGTPLTFNVFQRVLQILHSFLVQIASIFYGESISEEISGAPKYIEGLLQKQLKNDFHRFLAVFGANLQYILARSARGSARAPEISSLIDSP